MRSNAQSLITTLALCLASLFTFAQSQDTAEPHRLQFKNPPSSVHGAMSAEARKNLVTRSVASG